MRTDIAAKLKKYFKFQSTFLKKYHFYYFQEQTVTSIGLTKCFQLGFWFINDACFNFIKQNERPSALFILYPDVKMTSKGSEDKR